MKNIPKVFGLIQAKNEWPLLALSISHALMHHVDEVYVLNHASTDRSSGGLQHLQELWKDRIHVFSWYNEQYWQEVFANALIMISKTSSPDWLYVFDADEFLITKEFRSLKSILSEVDQEYSAIRYEVQNWISTEDFDEADLNHYRMLQYRSVANLFIEMYPTVYVDEILNGNLNFFDVPFPSKVIFRNDGALWLAAGAHSIRKPLRTHTRAVSSDELRVAHFPLLSRRKLGRKVNHGQRLIQDAFPPTHGWQSQMIYKFSQKNELDEFWRSHTIGYGNDSSKRTLPSFIIENGFLQTIEPALRLLEKSLNPSVLTVTERDPLTRGLDDSPITFGPIVQSVRSLQLMRLERDAAIAERDAAIAERDLVINSLTWRYTAFIRRIFRYARTDIKRRLQGRS
jgi:hypothetical protein